MSQKTIQTQKNKTMGDTAVDGLLAGILAGLGMAVYLVLAGLLTGIAPAMMLGRFDPKQAGNWLTGSVVHLAMSGVSGIIFALLFWGLMRLRPSLARWGWLLGLAYGLVLWALARGIMLPNVGSHILQIRGKYVIRPFSHSTRENCQ